MLPFPSTSVSIPRCLIGAVFTLCYLMHWEISLLAILIRLLAYMSEQ
jgi:hypothetical protein